jgi:hypothetical protein
MKKKLIFFFLFVGLFSFPLSLSARDVNDVRASLYPLLEKFSYRSDDGVVSVFSDISQKFSDDHARYAKKVWDYFASVYATTPGKRIEIYYTKDQALYDQIWNITSPPTFKMPDARQTNAFWDEDHRKWFIIPYTEPDFGTLRHEVGHDFLYFTYPKSEDFPWFKEGSGMYFESGEIDNEGVFEPGEPWPYFLASFRSLEEEGKLLPLDKLLTLPRDDFYKTDAKITYAQSMMFYFYLTESYPEIMSRLREHINNGEVSNNFQLIEFLTSSTSESLEDLEKGYRTYSLGAENIDVKTGAGGGS